MDSFKLVDLEEMKITEVVEELQDLSELQPIEETATIENDDNLAKRRK